MIEIVAPVKHTGLEPAIRLLNKYLPVFKKGCCIMFLKLLILSLNCFSISTKSLIKHLYFKEYQRNMPLPPNRKTVGVVTKFHKLISI